MKTIKYIPKVTAAHTQYREIDPEDQLWLQTELIRWQTLIGQLDQLHDRDMKIFRDYFWHHKESKRLHKGQYGPNTPCSTVAGILHNMMFKENPQRDLTDKQMEDIEWIAGELAKFLDTEAIRFQIGLAHE